METEGKTCYSHGESHSPLGTNDLRVMHARDSLTQLAMSRKYAEWPQGGFRTEFHAKQKLGSRCSFVRL